MMFIIYKKEKKEVFNSKYLIVILRRIALRPIDHTNVIFGKNEFMVR